MRISNFIIASCFLFSLVLGKSTSFKTRKWCGTSPPSKKDLFGINELSSTFRYADRVSRTTSINTYVHVINNGSGSTNGNITATMISRQIAVLNQAYDKKFKFRVVKIDRTTNSDWYTSSSFTNEGVLNEMKKALRKGTAKDLNLYFNNMGGGLLGIATLPSFYAEFPKLDGVVVRFNTIPGFAKPPYNLGNTGVHEIGHWLGLFHTFEGGCSTRGDLVADTPAEASPAYGCPKKRNTCKGINFKGLDPVNNYMDYSDDSCMNRFTQGQFTRMKEQWSIYRAGK